MSAIAEYEKLLAVFAAMDGVSSGQMFGKPCIKIKGKAFVAQHKDTVVFKLTGNLHKTALALEGAVLWDPSGKGRPMKEWVALPASESKHFATFSNGALA